MKAGPFQLRGLFVLDDCYSSPDLKLKVLVHGLASALPFTRRHAQSRGGRLHSPGPQHVTLPTEHPNGWAHSRFRSEAPGEFSLIRLP